jgi:hypothetical protein
MNWSIMQKTSLAFVLCIAFLNAKGQIQINEICPANADIIYDTAYFEFSPWIEIHNTSDEVIDLTGYHLSDDSSQPLKWQVPNGLTIDPHGYLVLWCDGNNKGRHTNFRLDNDGGALLFSSPDGTLVHEVTFPEQFTNVSFGRISNGDEYGYLNVATPGAVNSGLAGQMRLQEPEVSLEEGRYTGSVTVTISHQRNGVTIRYTLDGSEPDHTSSIYSTPLLISKTTTLKIKAFHNNYISSPTTVRTYFINEREFTLPVMSVTLNPKYLNDNTIGIYTIGSNGVSGNGLDYPANWNQDWFRHAHLEYFKPDGNKVFDQAVDLRVFGNYSRRKPQKSFAIKAREKYGSNEIEHKLFPTKATNEFGGFSLRNSGTDWNIAHFRDALMQHLTVGQLDLDYLAYQPAIVYLNGEYWGILNLRERIDADYFESNFGIKSNDLDLMEGRSNIHEGSDERYTMYQDSLRRIDRNNPNAIKFVERYIDVQNFINYQIHNIYIANTDWPGNNLKYWRQRSNNGKFRWILWDCDFGFGIYPDKSYPTLPSLEWATDPDNVEGHNREWSTRHLRYLLENPVFRQRFIQTMTIAMQTTYEPGRVKKIIDEFAGRVRTEMKYHKAKWGGNVTNWEEEINKLKNFADERNPYMHQHLKDFFGLTSEVTLDVKVTPENGGIYKLNGINSGTTLNDALYFRGLPFTATAITKPGYIFKHWKVKKKSVIDEMAIPLGGAWKFFDKGNVNDPDWNKPAFDDSSWSEGQGHFGYGDGDEKTLVSFGGSSSNKHVTTYFRKTIDIGSIANIERISASVTFDDGVIVYVNGTEIARSAMPTGEIAFETLASTTNENAVLSFLIDKSLLVDGQNTIAVEVHQNAISSSDLSFDFTMSILRIGEMEEKTTSSPAVDGVAYSDVAMEAVFEQINGIVINEISATGSDHRDEFRESDDWIELHNAGNAPVDIGGFYMTDNLNEKTKFRIPEGSPKTILEPGDYLVLWADNQTGQGPTHLNFRLAGEGETVGLYKKVGDELIALDEVIFHMQNDNQSWSRVPNATGPFGLTYYTTPAEINTPVLGAELDPSEAMSVYPNPTDGLVYVRSSARIEQWYLTDVYGRVVRSGVPQSQGTFSLDLTFEKPGVYLIKALEGSLVHYKKLVLK